MTTGRHIWYYLVPALLVLQAGEPCAAASLDGQKSLEGLTRDLSSKFSRVDQMIPEELERLQSLAHGLLLFDVREPAEFAVARLRGAEWMSPDIGARELAARIGTGAAGKTVVFYCSVGYRSSKVANRVRETLTALGARRVVNLQGGIFAWHNTGRELVDARGETIHVHPYDRRWGRYLDFDNLARTIPAD